MTTTEKQDRVYDWADDPDYTREDTTDDRLGWPAAVLGITRWLCVTVLMIAVFALLLLDAHAEQVFR